MNNKIVYQTKETFLGSFFFSSVLFLFFYPLEMSSNAQMTEFHQCVDIFRSILFFLQEKEREN